MIRMILFLGLSLYTLKIQVSKIKVTPELEFQPLIRFRLYLSAVRRNALASKLRFALAGASFFMLGLSYLILPRLPDNFPDMLTLPLSKLVLSLSLAAASAFVFGAFLGRLSKPHEVRA